MESTASRPSWISSSVVPPSPSASEQAPRPSEPRPKSPAVVIAAMRVRVMAGGYPRDEPGRRRSARGAPAHGDAVVPGPSEELVAPAGPEGEADLSQVVGGRLHPQPRQRGGGAGPPARVGASVAQVPSPRRREVLEDERVHDYGGEAGAELGQLGGGPVGVVGVVVLHGDLGGQLEGGAQAGEAHHLVGPHVAGEGEAVVLGGRVE